MEIGTTTARIELSPDQDSLQAGHELKAATHAEENHKIGKGSISMPATLLVQDATLAIAIKSHRCAQRCAPAVFCINQPRFNRHRKAGPAKTPAVSEEVPHGRAFHAAAQGKGQSIPRQERIANTCPEQI